ncbi:hypothetical protein H0H92_008571 [Tricholoma furcatifolium]|nr:hypothetical protein H0H92_008571 [Tricholoma furcatifolium]
MIKHHTLSSLADMKERPQMLLYDLGSFKEDPLLNERVGKLFQAGKNTFLVNASATGKTRLLYEGLTRHWGIYAPVHADEDQSKALQMSLLSTRFLESEWVYDLPKQSALGYRKLVDRNLELLDRRFSIILVIHLLVSESF